MAKIQFVNPSAVNTLYIDVDSNDRTNRYAKWVFSPSEAKSIHEAEIVDIMESASSLADSLTSGQLTCVATDIDSLTEIGVKNFLANGLGQKYYTLGENLAVNSVVASDSTNGTVIYPLVNGNKPVGVLQTVGTTGQYYRVKTSGTATVTAGGAVTSGGYLIGTTTGKVITSTTPGKWYIGKASTTVASTESLSITISINTIP